MKSSTTNKNGILRTLRCILEYKTAQTVLKSNPLSVGIEVSSICNLRCLGCPHGQEQPFEKKLIDESLFKNAIDQIKNYAVDIQLFGRGEPLTHPLLNSFLVYAKKNGLKVRINTNATLLTEEISRNLINNGLDNISFSLDGLSPEDYAQIRRNGNYENVVSNIKNFLTIKKQATNKPYTAIEAIDYSIYPIPDLHIRLAALKEQLQGLPVDIFRIIPQHSYAGSVKNVFPSIEKRNFHPCSMFWHSIYISVAGNVVCCNDWYGQMPLGNIHTQSIDKIWNGQVMQNTRKSLQNFDIWKKMHLCSKCEVPLTWKPFSFGLRNLMRIRKWISEKL